MKQEIDMEQVICSKCKEKSSVKILRLVIRESFTRFDGSIHIGTLVECEHCNKTYWLQGLATPE